MGKCGLGPNDIGIISFVDSHSGKELNSYRISNSISQVIPLPMTNWTKQKLHLFADNNAREHLFLRTDEALSIFLKHMSNIYLSFVDIEKGSIQGHGISNQDMSDMVFKDYCFKTTELWFVSFLSELGKIVTTTTKMLDEVIFLFMLQRLPKIILTMSSFP